VHGDLPAHRFNIKTCQVLNSPVVADPLYWRPLDGMHGTVSQEVLQHGVGFEGTVGQ
jgi:hypothetical protein